MIALASNIGQSSFWQVVAGNNKFSSSLKGIVSSTMIFLQHPCDKGRGGKQKGKKNSLWADKQKACKRTFNAFSRTRSYCNLIYITDGFKSSRIIREKHGNSIHSIYYFSDLFVSEINLIATISKYISSHMCSTSCACIHCCFFSCHDRCLRNSND